ncbi:RNase A-like domain-containing protein [Pantoea vagans]|uniref:RNase A-like domain-containing protein n=1 Tax=Pantoea vagans TaxID=470934 RepID=UPI00301AAF70
MMSPVQLTAAISDKTLTEREILSNRLYGGLNLAPGTLELTGATALCIAPDPSGLTKAACVIVGAHSLDSINAAANQVLTGRNTRTAFFQVASATAHKLGADDKTAINIALTVDISVPMAFAFAAGSVRVVSVRFGKLKLAEHEAVRGIKAGGHTIAKHINISEADLLARLARSPKMPLASSFVNIKQAEQFISAGLKANRWKIIYWAAAKSESLLELTWQARTVVSYGFTQGSTTRIEAYAVRIVLHRKMFNGKPYYLLTSYPSF